MPGFLKRIKEDLVSYRFAVVVIAILLGSSAAGWLVTEIFPRDFTYQREMYVKRWGGTAVRAAELFSLHDPFHSFWYTAVLALFFMTLLLCLLTRWRRFVARSFHVDPPGAPKEVEKFAMRIELSWNELASASAGGRDPVSHYQERYGRKQRIDGPTADTVFRRLSRYLSRKGFHVVSRSSDEGILFSAVRWRWRFLANFIFHAGLIVITVGGVIGSYWGRTEILYGKAGDRLPLYDSPSSILIEDFRIITTSRMEIRDYISRLSIVSGSGDTILASDIEVNRPLSYDGFRIYQSSYYVGDDEFKWATIEFVPKGGLRRISFTVTDGEELPLEGGGVLAVGRFFPDFRMGPGGAYSASTVMSNPALEITVTGENGRRRGWLFLYHPEFSSRFEETGVFMLKEVEPVFYTGLQISTNPGSPVLLGGIVLATIGIVALYLFNYRLVKGHVGPEALVIAGAEYKWKMSFENELKHMKRDLQNELAGELDGRRLL